MRIIICGAGRVGQGIAQRLSQEHDVTIIDENAQLLDQVGAQYEVRCLTGHAAHPAVLKAAGAENAEMIIAVTHTDEVNMVTCQVAHSLFKVTTKIARIRSQAYLKATDRHLFSQDNMPIDMHISPEVEVGQSILQRLKTPGAFLTANFAKGSVKLLGVSIEKCSPVVDATVKDVANLFPELDARIVGIGREKRIFTPSDEDVLMANDRVYWLMPSTSVSHMFDVLDSREKAGRHVVVVGAGNIGLYVARELEKNGDMRVRLIEGDARRAEMAAEKLKRAIVMHGEGLNPVLLDEAGVSQADLVIGLTSDDKTNLLLGALSKSLGARKVLALVNDSDLASLRGSVGVDILIDPRSVTVSRILLQLRHGRLTNLHTIEDGAAEVVEGVARETSQLIGMNLLSGDLPEGIVAGALVRNEKPISLGERVRAQDVVVLLAEREMARKVDQLYRVKPEYY